jgi:chloride channel protein, CIC family
MFSSPVTISFHQPQKQWQKINGLGIVITVILAILIGIGAGFGALLMEKIGKWVFYAFFEDRLFGLFDGIGAYYLVIVPAIGGLIVGAILIHFAPETKGRTVPDVLKSVAVRDEDIPAKSLAIKSLASALCAGTGGSVGLGGPSGQLGSAIGLAIGQFFSLSKEKIRLLFSCGVGAGIAAAFHAPIMGSIFAIEVILGRLSAGYFTVILISAVTADTIAQIFKGEFVQVQHETWVSSWELLLYATLGVIVAIGAMAFTKAMSSMKTFWDNLPVSDYFKPMLGGLLLGIVALIAFQWTNEFPGFLGLGSSSLQDALNGSLALNMVLALFLLKIFATSLTLGSGNAGGTFTPSFFMGAMLGGTFGHLVNLLFPTISVPIAAYAMAGMAAFVVGSMNAPITALMIGFEIIGGYQIIWPIMLTVLVTTLVIKSMKPQCRKHFYELWTTSNVFNFPFQLVILFWRCKTT